MVSAAAARNILTAIRTREDLTIVDAGSTLTEASAIAAEMADTVLIVTTPDVVSLRGVSRLCAQWERLKVEPPEVGVLLNRTSRRLEVPAGSGPAGGARAGAPDDRARRLLRARVGDQYGHPGRRGG